jgi:hypothetical protein
MSKLRAIGLSIARAIGLSIARAIGLSIARVMSDKGHILRQGQHQYEALASMPRSRKRLAPARARVNKGR